MVERADLSAQLRHCLIETSLPGFPPPVRGKVRDNYRANENEQLIIVTTDRLSAFDRVLTAIPFKGQVLNELAAFWFRKLSDVTANHLVATPDPNVSVVRSAKPLPVEMVVRGYLAGSLWRDYASSGVKKYCISLPAGLRRNQRLPFPILTPTSKAESGMHDEAVSREKIITGGMMNADTYDRCVEISMELFRRGSAACLEKGLILVDTKYEFGVEDDRIILIDELHTPDSSRFWLRSEYHERFETGLEQVMFDKENIRRWLIERGYMGDGRPPVIPDEERIKLSIAYIDLYEKLTGEGFAASVGPPAERIENNLRGQGYIGT